MEYIIITFRSREESIKFYKLLKTRGVNCTLTNTPKEAGASCGLSVKTTVNYFYIVKNIVTSLKNSTFVAIFLVKKVNGRNVVTTIY